MLNKRCPHCQQMIRINELKKLNTHKDFINRQPVSCPHCQKAIVLPALAEKLISIGLLFSVILAPLFYYWLHTQLENIGIITGGFFSIGILLLVIGVVKNQPQPVSEIQ